MTPSAASLQPAPPPPSVAQEPDPPPADEPRKVEPPAEEPATITIQVPDRTRWYYVERYEPGTQPEAFEATFDRDRNKIDIQTAGVTQFTIDTSRIPIDWERLVILGIDGRNSELRRRDFDLLRFQKNKYGQWVVVEP